jgi:hypothetical protein
MPARVHLALLTVITTLALAACGGSGSDDPGGATAATGASSTGSTGVTAATGASAATGPSSTGGSGSTTGASGTSGAVVPPTDLEDGRHFGYVRRVNPATSTLRFDLASFYSGDEANRIAAERGDETPVPNDYYIVNDNPRLRRLALAADADIEVFDWNRCCDETVQVDMATFSQALSAGADGIETDGQLIRGASQYWITLNDGVITKIEEQFLP